MNTAKMLETKAKAKRKKQQIPNGVILWEGFSNYNGETIAVIATGINPKARSNNPKTGPMIQVWIMTDENPAAAIKSGNDESVCGDCPHRPTVAKGNGVAKCYVNPMGPNAVWKSWKAGKYPKITNADWEQYFSGHGIRFGAWGDPGMVPESANVWQRLAAIASFHTSYTHQWRYDYAAYLKGISMASCDNLIDYVDASTTGWKTFRVAPDGDEKQRKEAHCAATAEMGYKTTCQQCKLCDGSKANVTVWEH